ncbi:hypothetical protein Nepgr_010674 [Nepenthes gracilis]|uniref:Uncharacterized protein n=1 Tax=Nepenthes gracilis TaxID=150966 RepID=A0AAD3XLJ8_NEPGR|nr:hypothetical protein Nepgr_010674 [Nepenthes gracilis]
MAREVIPLGLRLSWGSSELENYHFSLISNRQRPSSLNSTKSKVEKFPPALFDESIAKAKHDRRMGIMITKTQRKSCCLLSLASIRC